MIRSIFSVAITSCLLGMTAIPHAAASDIDMESRQQSSRKAEGDKEIEIDQIRYALRDDGSAEVVLFGKEWKENLDVTIPASISDDAGRQYDVTLIRKGAFATHCRFATLSIGDNVKVIEEGAFTGTRINTLVLGNGLTNLPEACFAQSGITTLTIGSALRHIGHRAFADCTLSKVICRSNAITAGDEAFANSSPDCGQWLNSILSIGERAFSGATFITLPKFTNLVSIGASAFENTTIPGTLALPASLRSIAPDAFAGSTLKLITMDAGNPFFSTPNPYMLCNKGCTRLVLLTNHSGFDFGDASFPFPEQMVRLGEGSIPARGIIATIQGRNTYRSITIPASIVEMEGAFGQCTTMGNLTCQASVPPAITDATFNEQIFISNPDITLRVPLGSADAYRTAPGWRRFKNIKEVAMDDLPASISSLPSYMVLHQGETPFSDLYYPVSSINAMSIDDNGATPRMLLTIEGGKELSLDAASIDSITWQGGFLYDEPEDYTLNTASPSAQARNCTITSADAQKGGDIQLRVRNAVLMPAKIDGAIQAEAFCIEYRGSDNAAAGDFMLTVPVRCGNNEMAVAARFDHAHGQWLPTPHLSDADGHSITINAAEGGDYGVFVVPQPKEDQIMLYSAYAPLVSKEELQSLNIYDRIKGLALGDEWIEASKQVWNDLHDALNALWEDDAAGRKLAFAERQAIEDKALKLQNEYAAMHNTRIRFHITDSSADDEHRSKYEDCPIRVGGQPDSTIEKNRWMCRLDLKGEGCIEINVADIINARIGGELILTGSDGIDKRSYAWSVTDNRRYESLIRCVSDIYIDLAQSGSNIEAPELRTLSLIYDRPSITVPYIAEGTIPSFGITNLERAVTASINLDNSNLRNVRLQKEIERYLAAINSIQIDEKGNILLGDNITGSYDISTGTGKGTFVINTSADFVEKNARTYETALADEETNIDEKSCTLLSGTIGHRIECQYEVKYNPASNSYNIHYTGSGTYSLKAEVIDRIEGVNFDTWPEGQKDVKVVKTRTIENNDVIRLEFDQQIFGE